MVCYQVAFREHVQLIKMSIYKDEFMHGQNDFFMLIRKE